MGKYRKPAVALLSVAALSAALVGCGSSGSSGGGSGKSGGTLNYLIKPAYDHLDPQRMYVGEELTTTNRLVYRSLVSFSAGTSAVPQMVPDLATTTGTKSADAKTWTFTLKSGVKWQDGKQVTCADLKYGLSRGFATDVITGGPNYALSYVDVPSKNGLPVYDGPYKKDNQALFDKAVTCSSDNMTITYHFKKPWPDFNQALSALGEFNPYRQDQDHGNASNFAVFSDGPYKLQGTWNQNTGGTFVRNPEWSASTDPIRKALPDKVVITTGLETAVIYQRLIADSGPDQMAITERNIPVADYAQITGTVKNRSTKTTSPYTDYLMPNQLRLTNPKVRQALALAADTADWINIGGGSNAYLPSYDVVNPQVTGYAAQDIFKNRNQNGDIAKANALLKSAGVKMPYPIKFTYQSLSPTNDKQAEALQAAWNNAGFKVTLDPQSDKYYTIIQNPGNSSDVVWAGWGADWPSISTDIPPLFDSRINLTSASNGQDYGNYKSDVVNGLIDTAASTPDTSKQVSTLQQADAQIANDIGYIPLEIPVFYRLHGSHVTGYQEDSASNGYPDLAVIGVN